MAKQSVVVIGLGRFGTSVAQTLTERGHEVLGVDADMKTVEKATDLVTQAVQADASDEETLVELGVRNFDIGVVAISSDVKSSILITLLLKRLGLGTVIAKAQDELHGEILSKVGADRVVYPNRDTGVRVAHSISAKDVIDYMEMARGYAVAKFLVPPDLAGKELGSLQLKEKYGINVLILLRRQSQEMMVNPSKYERLAAGDTLLISGRDEDIDRWRSA